MNPTDDKYDEKTARCKREALAAKQKYLESAGTNDTSPLYHMCMMIVKHGAASQACKLLKVGAAGTEYGGNLEYQRIFTNCMKEAKE
jgi:hypothetical protein